METLIIDNYDSFTFNLFHLIRENAPKNEIITIRKNDEITTKQALSYDRIVSSPGPGVPKEAGKLLDIIEKIKNIKPFLGICLGHQAMAECFNGSIVALPHPAHGETTDISLCADSLLFRDIPYRIRATRYHSWAVSCVNLPECLQIISQTDDEIIMALQHIDYPLYGIQFHPEAFSTQFGSKIIKNFYAI